MTQFYLHIIELIITIVLVPFALNAFKKARASEKMSIHLARSEIIRLWRYAKQQGRRNEYESRQYYSLYEEYKAGGGNSFIDEITDEYSKIPFE